LFTAAFDLFRPAQVARRVIDTGFGLLQHREQFTRQPQGAIE
jgi:hypothetical protein